VTKVRIVTPSVGDVTGDLTGSGYGTRIFLDGKELQGVVSIQVGVIDLDTPLSVTVTMLASELDITEFSADVTVNHVSKGVL
jgi:hypothetical protein